MGYSENPPNKGNTMKTRTFTKELVVSEDPLTNEDLKKALTAYKPTSVRDFIVTCGMHATAEKALEKGLFEGPGVYRITDIWFSKEVPWHKVICRVKKIS